MRLDVVNIVFVSVRLIIAVLVEWTKEKKLRLNLRTLLKKKQIFADEADYERLVRNAIAL